MLGRNKIKIQKITFVLFHFRKRKINNNFIGKITKKTRIIKSYTGTYCNNLNK